MYWKRKISQADCVLMPDSIKLEKFGKAMAMANQSPNLELVSVEFQHDWNKSFKKRSLRRNV